MIGCKLVVMSQIMRVPRYKFCIYILYLWIQFLIWSYKICIINGNKSLQTDRKDSSLKRTTLSYKTSGVFRICIEPCNFREHFYSGMQTLLSVEQIATCFSDQYSHGDLTNWHRKAHNESTPQICVSKLLLILCGQLQDLRRRWEDFSHFFLTRHITHNH